MLKKRCDRCKRYSFGNDEIREWICPYCQKDITYIKSEPPVYFTVRNHHAVKDRKRDDFLPESMLQVKSLAY